jgi:hypothetical protein
MVIAGAIHKPSAAPTGMGPPEHGLGVGRHPLIESFTRSLAAAPARTCAGPISVGQEIPLKLPRPRPPRYPALAGRGIREGADASRRPTRPMSLGKMPDNGVRPLWVCC